ncbi:MAG TPA: DUF6518 family protein [Candidatus Dormibacteraeota bacterium]
MQRSASVGRAARLGALVLVGLGVGVATALLQGQLGQPWLSLVNAASPWLAPMFILGTLWQRPTRAALAGVATGLLELLGYFVTAAAHGYTPADHTSLLFWAVCALIGGPIFGTAGWLWWRRNRLLSALGGACLPAAFFAEGGVVYGWELHYDSTALLFFALGLVLLAVLGLRGWQHRLIGLWLLVALPAGVAAELLLGLVYSQAL